MVDGDGSWRWGQLDGLLSPLILARIADSSHEDRIWKRDLEQGRGRVHVASNQAWVAPSVGWWKVNTDGSHIPVCGLAACGGVIKDCCDMWIRGFSKSIGRCTILEAELWGIHIGLEMAWSLGCRKLIVESDSKDAIRIVQQIHGCCGVNSLVLHIRKALQRPWKVVV
ncbi:hypothetical protein V6N11_059295 [Hibiscus sabdariffa]|uniref:RNase H type-1 domain-containing protein n=1 Tax=Hibiscus sabdariffa TaxID=183260 RepID=A0ABR2U6U4_9ROSI